MFRFAIREMFWMTAVVGMALGWWVEQRKIRAEVVVLRQSHASLNEIRQMLGSEEKLGELIEMARAYNVAPVRPNTLVISMK